MNIKAYIDFFSEIADLERSQQFKYLEQAEAESNRQFKIPIFKFIAVATPLLIGLILVALVYIWADLSTLVLFVLIVVGLVLSRVIVSELNAIVLRKGLIAVIRNNK